jgi:hypothetical protein
MSGPQRYLALAIVLFVALPALPAVTAAQTTCGFRLGFAALRDLIPDVVGECLEDERFNMANGNAEQRTTGGLLVWRKADNWTAFTDGTTTWINGPDGLASRANDGPLFPWETVLAPSTTASARAASVPAAGRLLLADYFDDATVGVLAKSSPSPAQYQFAYVEGEYVIRKLDTGPGLPVALLPGQYENASLAVDVRLVSETEDRYVALACRRQPADGSQYRLSVIPDDGRFILARWDGTEATVLRRASSAAIQRGEATNRLELVCSGSTVAVFINGEQVAAVQDGIYASGTMSIGAGALVGSSFTAEARFDNLFVNER